MKVYLHLADEELVLADLSLRLYEGDIPLSTLGITLTPLTTLTDYVLDGIPSPGTLSDGLTLTYETPSGVYHSRRIGAAETQPLNVIIPIREVVDNPLIDLSIKLFIDGVESDLDGDLSADRLSIDGEYNVSGWTHTPLNEQWSLRWIYNGLVYAHSWIGESIAGSGTYYLEILAVQSPFDISPDPLDHPLWSVNFECMAKGPSVRFEKEIAQLLVNAGLGIRGNINLYPAVNIMIGRGGTVPESDPDNDVPIITIINTGGSQPDETQDGSKYEHLTCQILVRAIDYDVARDRIYSIWRELDGKRNITVVAA